MSSNISTGKQSNTEKGLSGEAIAASLVNSKGYQIIKKNFRFGRHGEIDIIAKDGLDLVFIEVKLRKSSQYGSALDSITAGKQKALRRAAEGYLHINKIEDTPCRFDVIAIELHHTPPTITHLKNAF